MKKFTKKELFNELLNLEGVTNNEALSTFILNEIVLLDKKAAKAKERALGKTSDGDELRSTVYGKLDTETFKTIDEVYDLIGDKDITSGMVRARLTALAAKGLVEKQELTVLTGKTKRKVQGYRIIK